MCTQHAYVPRKMVGILEEIARIEEVIATPGHPCSARESTSMQRRATWLLAKIRILPELCGKVDDELADLQR